VIIETPTKEKYIGKMFTNKICAVSIVKLLFNLDESRGINGLF
jgi:hypothetical protein